MVPAIKSFLGFLEIPFCLSMKQLPRGNVSQTSTLTIGVRMQIYMTISRVDISGSSDTSAERSANYLEEILWMSGTITQPKMRWTFIYKTTWKHWPMNSSSFLKAMTQQKFVSAIPASSNGFMALCVCAYTAAGSSSLVNFLWVAQYRIPHRFQMKPYT